MSVLRSIIIGLLAFFLGMAPDAARAGWYYSSYYRPGYSWYNAGYYGGNYHYAGYYQYYAPTVVYYPATAVFATYNPAAVTVQVPYQTTQLTTVANLQQQQATRTVTTTAVADPYAACHQKTEQLDKRLAALETLIKEAMQHPPQPAPQPAPQAKAAPMPPAKLTTGLEVASVRCAACHEKTVAESKGGKFVMFDGAAPVQLTERQVNAMYKRVLSRQMPPKDAPQFEGDEGGLFMQWVGGLTK